MTVQAVRQLAGARLSRRSASPFLDAEVLLAAVLRTSRTYLAAHPETVLTPKQLRRFRDLIERRRTGWPVAYLIGRCEFFGLPLRVNRHVLVPRPATELIVQAALDRLSKSSTSRIADIGTGSGAIALALAYHRPHLKVVAIEPQLQALSLARLNGRALRLHRRIRWLHGSLTDPRLRTASIVIANLPYLTPRQARAASLRREPRTALVSGPDGLQHIRQFLQHVRYFPDLRTIILECDPTQAIRVQRLLRCTWPTARLTPLTDGRWTRGIVAER